MGIRSGVLDTIDYDFHHKAEDCFNAVCEEWLDIDTSATWCTLIQAIDSIIADVVQNSSNQLKEFYINERYKSKEEDWPPYQPDHFTGVALIHHKERHITVRESIAVVSTMYRGNINRELNRQSLNIPDAVQSNAVNQELPGKYLDINNDITKLFAPLRKSISHFTLIEGAPGIGKTILSREIAYQWANKTILADKQLLFLIYLRDPFLQHIKSLKEFVSYAICISHQNINIEIIAEHLENKLGKDMTIVLDGYDEMSKELRKSSFIADIIQRKF